MSTPLARFRVVGLLEGLSFLVLLFIAMPLKYLAGQPLAVRVVGLAHGILFILYLLCVIEVAKAHRWSTGRVAAAVGASLLPFGPPVFDAWLRREAQALGSPER